MEDDLHFKVNGRQPQFVGKQKKTCPKYVFLMEDDLNVLYQEKTSRVSYYVNQAQLAPVSPEVGTAQPQLVFSFSPFPILMRLLSHLVSFRHGHVYIENNKERIVKMRICFLQCLLFFTSFCLLSQEFHNLNIYFENGQENVPNNQLLVRVACVCCHGTKCPLLTAFFSLSLPVVTFLRQGVIVGF